MKATSTQNIKNVKDICFDITNYPAEMESKLTIVASTNDDIFAFEFEGPDLLQSCKKSGLFTGWEKDQQIRGLEEKIKQLERDNMFDKETADHWSKEYYNLSKNYDKLQEEIKEKDKTIDILKRKYNIERCANEAQHKFFKKYAGEGTEIDFNYVIDDVGEVSYVIIGKEEYKYLKDNSNRCTMINGRSYTPAEMVDRIVELEELKTPTIENFEEPYSRSYILDLAKKCVCGKREQDYGTPESNFQLIADLWNQYLFKEPGAKEVFGIGPMDVSMMMALMKIARIRNGGGSGDSFVDLAGYAACGGEIWHSNKETNTDSNQETN